MINPKGTSNGVIEVMTAASYYIHCMCGFDDGVLSMLEELHSLEIKESYRENSNYMEYWKGK